MEGNSKPGEAKSKLLSSANRAFSRACGRLQIVSRFSHRLDPRRPASARVDVRRCAPQRLAIRMEPRLLRKSRPAIHARLASCRARGLFWEPRATIAQILKIGNKNRRDNAPVGDNARIIKTKYPRRAPSLALPHSDIRPADASRSSATASAGEIATGLIYVNDQADELHDILNTTTRPLNQLSEPELCPRSKALAGDQRFIAIRP